MFVLVYGNDFRLENESLHTPLPMGRNLEMESLGLGFFKFGPKIAYTKGRFTLGVKGCFRSQECMHRHFSLDKLLKSAPMPLHLESRWRI